MNMPGQSHEFRDEIGDIEQYLRLQGINDDVNTAFTKDAHLAVALRVEDQFGQRTERVLGGLVPIEVNQTDYADITLIRSKVLGRQVTSLVASGIEYDITPSRVSLANNPYHILVDSEVEKIRFWVSRRPPIAIWSLEASMRLAEQWRESRANTTKS
jgi:hypothetical protein